MSDRSGQPKTLTARQELFVAAYLGDAKGNATEAARIAGYKQPQSQGPRLLQKVEIASRVRDHIERRYADADAVLAELADVGFAEWREFVEILQRDKEGKPLRVKFDLSNKVRALELLGKHLQLFTDKLSLSGRVDHVHRVPEGLRNLSDEELDALEAIAQRAYATGDV